MLGRVVACMVFAGSVTLSDPVLAQSGAEAPISDKTPDMAATLASQELASLAPAPLEFKVQSYKFKVTSSQFTVQSSKFKVHGSKFKLASSAFQATEGAAGETAVGATRPAALMPLYASLVGLQLIDARTTLLAVRTDSARELNPAMRTVSNNWGAMLAVKSFSSGVTIFATEHLWEKNRAAAIATMIGINAAYAFVVANNLRVMQQ